MQIEICPDEATVASHAARVIADHARLAISARGRFILAMSGGRTPNLMLRQLAGENLSWSQIHILQVDERVAPAGDADRNLTHLRENLVDRIAIPHDNIHPMPVEMKDLAAGAHAYALSLTKLAGAPPIIDVVHLGLGNDGHTASLVPGDPVLHATADVATTQPYQDHRRMTLTFAAINRARHVLWVVTGAEKRAALAQLMRGDPAIPASHIAREKALVLADAGAAQDSMKSQDSGNETR